MGVVLFILGLIGIYDLVKSREGWVKREINRLSDNYAEKAREEKREDLSSILDRVKIWCHLELLQSGSDRCRGPILSYGLTLRSTVLLAFNWRQWFWYVLDSCENFSR